MKIEQHRQFERRQRTRRSSLLRFELPLIVVVSLLSLHAFAGEAVQTLESAGPRAVADVASATLLDALSPWGMFVHADLLVKAVIIGLTLASIATWTVLLVKTTQLRAAKREARRALAILLSAPSLLDAPRHFGGERNPAVLLLATAIDEVVRSRGLPAEGIKERAAWQLERIEVASGQRIGRGMGVLATVGAI